MSSSTTSILFGESRFLARRKYIRIPDESCCYERSDSFDSDDDHGCFDVDQNFFTVAGSCFRKTARYFLGFMYEEDGDSFSTNNKEFQWSNDDVFGGDVTVESSLTTPSIWNRLNGALCMSLMLESAATAVPVALVTAMTEFKSSNGADYNFATKATAAAVLGTSVGKFVNGLVTDLVGARRTTVIYSAFLAIALLRLALSTTPESAVWACFWTEFCASVQWPTVIVTLATHYRGHGTMYEGGIYLAALAARVGSLVGIIGSSVLLNRNIHWRIVAAIGAWMALQASAFSYLYAWDAPSERNQPQNPFDPVLWKQYIHFQQQQQQKQATSTSTMTLTTMSIAFYWVRFLILTIVWPSMKHVLGSSVFWLVAVAHSGASMAKSSVRVVATYLTDTNNEANSHEGNSDYVAVKNDGQTHDTQISGLAVFLSLGTLAGLIVAGHFFAMQANQARRRKWLVSKLYLTMILSCYCLAFLAIPTVRTSLDDVLLPLQVSSLFVLGVGISVPYYHLPSLVSANFPQHKALFLSLTEGVAYGIAGWLWNVVGRIVSAGDDGWAYGWACVALLLILTAVIMVEFLEHYYCRHEQPTNGGQGMYETIVFA